jgi:hypothetical protein
MSVYSRKPVVPNVIQWDGSGQSALKVKEWVTAHGGQLSDHMSCCEYLILHLPGGGSDYVYSGAWVVQEGAHFDTYTAEEFPVHFSKMEFQAEHGAPGTLTDVAGFDLSWCPKVEDRNLINELVGLEYVSTDNQIDGDSWMFKPYPISMLGKLLAAIRDDSDEQQPEGYIPTFLEVGCGPGTKLLMVNKIFGLSVIGFDYNPQYCADARTLLESRDCLYWEVEELDAFDQHAADLYEDADIIYLNRPYVHLEKQALLEAKVFSHMKPDAYIILANYAVDANLLGGTMAWRKVAEDKVAVVLQKR